MAEWCYSIFQQQVKKTSLSTIPQKEMNDLAYRRKQLKELQENVVDLEDISGGISITDLTLNDFRMDLSEYMKENMVELEQAPPAVYALTAMVIMPEPEIEPGVIFCLKNTSSKRVEEPLLFGASLSCLCR